MYNTLSKLVHKPALFETFDTAALWTDPHIAKMMLALHLDETNGLASRPIAEIDSMVGWISEAINLKDKHLVDLGCGPGLYSTRFSSAGAKVTGMDVSKNSIEYALSQSIPRATFITGNYHTSDLPNADVYTLIYGDACAMSPEARAILFSRIHETLSRGGSFILDAFDASLFDGLSEGVAIENNREAGFWSPLPHVLIKSTFLYPESTTSLDRFLIVEEKCSRWVNNWMQYMHPEQLSAELRVAGFHVGEPLDVLNGKPVSETRQMFTLVASKA